MSLDKLKLSKPLASAMIDAGFTVARPIQEKVVSRIIGGQDIIALAPEGSGKTTAYIIGILLKLRYPIDEPPRALVLVPNAEQITEVVEQFQLLNKNKLVIHGCLPTGGIQSQINNIADGCDVVVTTPDRAKALYMKAGINANKVQVMVIDNADQMIKNGMQLPIYELGRGFLKCQHLVFTEVMHDKLNNLLEPFMKLPATIEVTELPKPSVETIEQILYHVPNYKTKLNLLNLLMSDDEYFTKVIVFVNTRFTAQKLFKSLDKRIPGAVALLKPMFFDLPGFKNINDFKAAEVFRVFIVSNEDEVEEDLSGIPFILHFDLPEEKKVFIDRVVKPATDEEVIALTFSTDIELTLINKIEQTVGKKMELVDLPAGLIIENNPNKEKAAQKKEQRKKEEEEFIGTAFHEKKAKNAKDYNFSSKEKAKMKYKYR
ncbi:DEAD/DEAH box helicase [Solitalea sp. MAHUQ-68]|uniref:DEAD/DEAH box helicase n=1 Tax=Solitalea agri TaxID=2953739 RepID=A0A9X2F8A1_9SPHI|nr:DEAD/DEAH box helicase [Solitalea agri]